MSGSFRALERFKDSLADQVGDRTCETMRVAAKSAAMTSARDSPERFPAGHPLLARGTPGRLVPVATAHLGCMVVTTDRPVPVHLARRFLVIMSAIYER
jgi:hypothetical protein